MHKLWDLIERSFYLLRRLVIDSHTFTMLRVLFLAAIALMTFSTLKNEVTDRAASRDLRAWQTIRESGGKPGNHGRIEALIYLTKRGAALNQADLSEAWLAGIVLTGRNMDEIDLRRAHLERSKLDHVSLRRARLEGARFEEADLSSADLSWANLSSAELRDADLSNANLHGAIVDGVNARNVRSWKGANIYGVQSSSGEFRDDAVRGGAVVDSTRRSRN